MSYALILHLLLTFKYEALYIFVLAEGLFTPIAAGAFIPQHIYNFWWALLITVAADTTGDFLYYTFGKKLAKTSFARYVGLSTESLHKMRQNFASRGPQTIVIAKLSSYLAVPAIVAAGATRMPKKQFYTYCLVAAIPKAFGLLTIGYFFGQNIHHAVKAVTMASIAISLYIVVHIYVARYLRQARIKKAGKAKKFKSA